MDESRDGGPDRELTQRERRAMRARKEGHRSAGTPNVRRWAKTALIVLAIALPVAGVVWLNLHNQAVDCPGHWHAGMSVIVNGQTVDYTGYNLESGVTPMRAHFHRGSEGVWHMEPPTRGCQPFRSYLAAVQTQLSDTEIVLTGEHGLVPAGTYAEDGNNTVRAFVRPPDGGWNETSVSSILGRQLEDGERILFLYGNYTDEQIRSFQDAVPVPPGPGQG